MTVGLSRCCSRQRREERDGIAAEPPIDVEKRAANWELDAIDWARERGLHKLTLSMFPHNDGKARAGLDAALPELAQRLPDGLRA
jgi:hypothetical protein